jgi:hypothetical protein
VLKHRINGHYRVAITQAQAGVTLRGVLWHQTRFVTFPDTIQGGLTE